MRDLEIRGAGNILGPEQSGHIATVGYEMYCQLLEEAVRQLKNQPKPVQPDAHVDIGISAFIPKTYIPGDRQRMDVYRRLTRCTSIEMLGELQQDVTDAFGELPRQAIILFALTELRLLAGLYGIESVIRKPPDVVLTVRDASKAQPALVGAPGTLRVIDEKTVYLRMPASFNEPETLLMVLKNLMRQAYDRSKDAQAAPPEPEPAKPPPPKPAPKSRREAEPLLPHPQIENLKTLRDQGVLTEKEFQDARQRILARAE
jgi:transcription-repair coupling factor (superfamily II helicase)